MIRSVAAILALSVSVPSAALPADAQSRTPGAAPLATSRVVVRGWDPSVRNKQIVVPVEIAFDDPADYDAVTSGRLPIGITVTNGTSGRTVHLAPRFTPEKMEASSERKAVIIYVLASNPAAPAWDANGCFETGATAARRDAGVEIALRLSPCGATTARVAGVTVNGGHDGLARPGAPIKGVIVKGGRNPSGNMRITPWPGYVGDDAGAQIAAARARPGAAGSIVVRLDAAAAF